MGLEPLEGPDARGIFRRFAVVEKPLRIAAARVLARIIAVGLEHDGDDVLFFLPLRTATALGAASSRRTRSGPRRETAGPREWEWSFPSRHRSV